MKQNRDIFSVLNVT